MSRLAGHQSIPKINLGEEAFLAWVRRLGLPEPERNYVFSALRKYQIDFAWREMKLGVEIDGGIWRKGGGAHTGAGHLRDMEKGNMLLDLGWRVYHFTPPQCRSGAAAQHVARFFAESQFEQ